MEIEEGYRLAKQLLQELNDLVRQFDLSSKNLLPESINLNLRMTFANNLTSAAPPALPPPWAPQNSYMEIQYSLPEPPIQNNEPSEEEGFFIAEE